MREKLLDTNLYALLKKKKKRNPFYDIQDVTKLSKTFLTHRKAAMTDSGV